MSKFSVASKCPDTLLADTALASIHPQCLNILYSRGIDTVEKIKNFLFSDPYKDSFFNTNFKDMDKAVQRLIVAMEQPEQIVVYHDYDVDGCTACAIIVENLRHLGVDAQYYANDRFIDGYGLCVSGVEKVRERFPAASIILTVDNGIVANEAVDFANSLGFDVIITDHHEPNYNGLEDILPNAVAVVDPKRHDETYPFHYFCGAGVAFKVMLALYTAIGKDVSSVFQSLDLVALATVADIVPLLDENRELVKEGMKIIREGQRPFFEAAFRILELKEVNAHYAIAFRYAPMVNAVSRMGKNTDMVVEAFLCKEQGPEIDALVAELQEINEERKGLTEKQAEAAQSWIDLDNLPTAITVCDACFSEGVVGIVAGRLKTEYNRPVFVFSPVEDNKLKASCRSIDGFNLKENLDKVSDLLVGYGGHAKAAGLTIEAKHYEEFCRRVNDLANECLSPEDLVACRTIDTVVEASALSVQLVEELKLLEPFGEGFPVPLLGLTTGTVSTRFMGEDDKHVKYTDSSSGIPIIVWSGGEKAKDKMNANKPLPKKFIGFPQLNNFRGDVSVQFIAEDI